MTREVGSVHFHTSLLKLLSSETRTQVIRFLFTHQAQMTEREIASILGVSHMTINRIMQELAAINFVSYTTAGRAHFWSINPKSYAHESLSNLLILLDESNATVTDLENTILSVLPKRLLLKVILFGSIIKETEESASDIDLFVLVKNSKAKETLARHN